MDRDQFYILEDDNTAVAVKDQGDNPSCIVWAEWMEANKERRIVRQDQVASVFVSTVFLGSDHQLAGEGPVEVFETMTFKADGNREEQGGILVTRYSTWDDAFEGHQKAIDDIVVAYAESTAAR